MYRLSSRQKVFAVAVTLLISIASFIGISISRAGKVDVTVSVLPKNAEVYLEGKEIGAGRVYLKPGTYTFIVKAEGFQTLEQPIVVSESIKNIVDLAPIPRSTQAQEYVRENDHLYQKFEERGGQRAANIGTIEREQNPIIEYLPFTDEQDDYTIGYKPKGDGITLTVYGDSSLKRQLALGKIKSWGFEPAEYQIEFIDHLHPLTGESSHD